MNLNVLAAEIHKNNVEKGFYDEPKNTGEMIALMHSELSEALEADRKERYFKPGGYAFKYVELYDLSSLPEGTERSTKAGKEAFELTTKDTMEDEMADALIRILDFCAFKKIDIDWHVKQKVWYNTLRPHKHGKKY